MPKAQRSKLDLSFKAEVSLQGSSKAPSPNIVVVIQRVVTSHRPRWSALAPPTVKGANDRARTICEFTLGHSQLILLETFQGWSLGFYSNATG